MAATAPDPTFVENRVVLSYGPKAEGYDRVTAFCKERVGDEDMWSEEVDFDVPKGMREATAREAMDKLVARHYEAGIWIARTEQRFGWYL
jgi:hypothetical protein